MTSQELAAKGKTVVEMAQAIANKEPLPDWVLIDYARAVSDAYLFLQHKGQRTSGKNILWPIPEFCWRCSCQKSGWVNVPNEVLSTCADNDCPCHKKERAS